MFTPTYDQQWLQRKIAEGEDGFINAGGERTELSGHSAAEMSSMTPYSQRKAFAKFVEFSRRKKQLSQLELAEKLGVDIDEIIAIEDESAVSIEPDTVYALATEFDIPSNSLMVLAGLSTREDNDIMEASIRFAANSGSKAPLQPEENRLLETFVHALTSAR